MDNFTFEACRRCKKTNLITLCDKCHGITNGNRDYWYAYFMYITNQEATHDKIYST